MKKTFVTNITLFLLVFSINTYGQDIATIYKYSNTTLDLQELLFNNSGEQLNLLNLTSQFKSTETQFGFYTIYDNLTCSGDFDGDGKDEVAIFVKMKYYPNCNVGLPCPSYYRTNVIIMKSDGSNFHPIGSWYSELDTVIDVAKIRFAVSGDFNKDGKSDIAFVYSNGSSASSLMVLKSTGNSFSSPTIFYNALTTSYKLDSVMFALSGDYNGDGYSDMALIYKNNTIKNISVFTSTGTVFNAAQSYYTFPDSLIMTQIKFALSGKFTSDAKSDIALLYKSDYHSAADSGNVILILKAMVNSFANPKTYINLTSTISNYSKVLFATTSDFNSDGLSDIALAYNTQTGSPVVQKILVIHSHDSLFASPVSYWSTNTNIFNFSKVKHFVAGKFAFTPTVQACTWQGNKQGALTFSFDDGYATTVQNAQYLNTKGVRGSHNIITQHTDYPGHATWAQIQADTMGNEYGSHTQTHPFLNNITLSAAATELTGSKQDLISHFSTDAVSLAFPDGGFDNDILQSSAMRNSYLSARTSMEGYNLSTPTDMYALRSQVMLDTTSLNTINAWLDNTVNYSYWTFFMYHYIDSTQGVYSTTVANFKAAVDIACQKNLWIDSHEHIMKYITERNALKPVTYTIQNTNTIKLNLDDGLINSIYNVPLTVKVAMQACMKDSVNVTQSGISKYYPVVNENGSLYSYINCLPNNTDIVVSQSISNTVSTRTICQGNSLVVGSHTYITSGTYVDSLKTALGCDSIVKTILTVNPKYIFQIPRTICQGNSLVVGTHTYNTSGTYIDTLKTFQGCDSIITTALTVNPLPINPGTISGAISVNQGQNSVTYTVPSILYASSYIWTLPNGATGTSTTSSIVVNYGVTATSGTITVKGHNSCGDGLSSSLSITVNYIPFPAAAGTISGPTSVCRGQDSVVYTVPAITNATSYVWTLPNGTTGTSSTDSILVIYGNTAVSGNITVKGTNSNGTGTASSLSVIVNFVPIEAGQIIGLNSVCKGESAVNYTVPSIGNALSYIWTLPTGATGASTTNSINVDYGTTAVSGNIKVKGSNMCGNGDASSLPITIHQTYNTTDSVSICHGQFYNFGGINDTTSGIYYHTFSTIYGCDSVVALTLNVLPLPDSAATISGSQGVCKGANNVVFTVPIITNATSYYWTLPTGATGLSTTNSISLNFGSNAVTGNLQVCGHNQCGNGNPSLKNIIINSTLPDSAKMINSATGFQSDTVCSGENNVHYSTSVIQNATSYLWYYTGNGATINGTGNNITINFSSSATSGDLLVSGHNGCGDGTFSPYFPIDVIQCNGISENNEVNEYKIYPNPAKEILIVETNFYKEQKLEIINLLGQTLYTTYINKTATVNISAFPCGVYILKLYTEKGNVFKKIVKQ